MRIQSSSTPSTSQRSICSFTSERIQVRASGFEKSKAGRLPCSPGFQSGLRQRSRRVRQNVVLRK